MIQPFHFRREPAKPDHQSSAKDPFVPVPPAVVAGLPAPLKILVAPIVSGTESMAKSIPLLHKFVKICRLGFRDLLDILVPDLFIAPQ